MGTYSTRNATRVQRHETGPRQLSKRRAAATQQHPPACNGPRPSDPRDGRVGGIVTHQNNNNIHPVGGRYRDVPCVRGFYCAPLGRTAADPGRGGARLVHYPVPFDRNIKPRRKRSRGGQLLRFCVGPVSARVLTFRVRRTITVPSRPIRVIDLRALDAARATSDGAVEEQQQQQQRGGKTKYNHKRRGTTPGTNT